jgi:replication initiation protein RepC
MEPQLATTPFGRRTMTLALVAAQAAAKSRAPDAAAHKWSVYRAICTAKEQLGLGERSLAVLDALLSFHPETVLSGDALVVFPSNAQLALRAHGMPASTLRKHLAVLVDAGVVLRRDSPNGKRYARKGRAGEITQAFGFDLSPLVARAQEFEALAEEVREQERALRYARERITLARRDIVKLIATGIAEQVPVAAAGQGIAGWEDILGVYRGIVGRLPRTPTLAQLEPIAAELGALADEILSLLETHVKTKKTGANESPSERHIQNSNSNSLTESEPAFDETRAAAAARGENLPPKAAETAFPLGMVLQACPDIADYCRGGISSWRDLVAAAGVARAALGISPTAWEAARAQMGEPAAAIVVAAILQRGEAVASAGGYLRALTRKAQANEFSLGPMLMALIGARNRERKRA